MKISFALTILCAAIYSSSARICPAIYSPVCGNDGKTYSSACFLTAARDRKPSLRLAYRGACRVGQIIVKRETSDEPACPEYSKRGICTLEYSPVCATNGQTYPNFCSMCADMYAQQAEGNNIILNVASYGSCTKDNIAKREVEAELDCSEFNNKRFCTTLYKPICGTDGKTYTNKCILCARLRDRRAKGEDTNLQIGHFGRCDKSESTSMSPIVKRDVSGPHCLEHYNTGGCTREYMPVCGSDGTTYGNTCTFCYNKHLAKKNGKVLRFERFGECEEVDI